MSAWDSSGKSWGLGECNDSGFVGSPTGNSSVLTSNTAAHKYECCSLFKTTLSHSGSSVGLVSLLKAM